MQAEFFSFENPKISKTKKAHIMEIMEATILISYITIKYDY